MTQRWGEEGQTRGRGREKKEKMPASKAYEFAERPLVATDCFSGNAFAANENLVH